MLFHGVCVGGFMGGGWRWRLSLVMCHCSFRWQALAPLDTTLEEMRDKLPSSDPSFRYRMKAFMDELLLVRGGWSIVSGISLCV